ncbi:MAG: SDR family oxidoreductase [Gracilibacteraceae bacterium]|jgi:NAD(P)-dependent dehydrogenase (short-subunit alcohol dehydrogenase family)|nr:SDR family oxidoreductase [Gracilibacteraceae bacterium]
MGILENRKAILVGASSGVGYGCALRFAEEGADVVVGARRLEKLEALVDDAKQRGFAGKIIPVECDVANEADLDKIINKTVELFGRIDILACIAQGGLYQQTYFMDTTPELANIYYQTGPIYTMLMIQKCMPYFEKQHYGRIITCASGSGVSNTPGFTGYAMAKAAIMAITRKASKEFGKLGVVTNCFLPVIKNDVFGTDEQSKIAEKATLAASPVGFMGDAYEHCSPVVAFMASEGAGYMNGQFIGVCGGLQMLA